MIRILLTDDDARIRSIVREYAQAEDWVFEEAGDGEEALRLFAAGSFSLVVLDVMMPRLDGWGVLKQIRKTSTVPVILLTARNEEYDRLLGFELGVDDYIGKPFSPRELIARMKALIKRAGAAQGAGGWGRSDLHALGRTARPPARRLALHLGDRIRRGVAQFHRRLGCQHMGQPRRMVRVRDETVARVIGQLRGLCLQMRALGPAVKLPAKRAEGQPVDPGIGDGKIARRPQIAANRRTIHHIEHATVSEYRDALVRVGLGQLGKAAQHPLGKVAQRFTGLEIVVQFACVVLRMGVRMRRLRLGHRHALKHAIVTLTETPSWLHGACTLATGKLGGTPGALEVAGEQQIERHVGQRRTQCQSLGFAEGIEIDVDLPLIATFGIPGGFTMADKTETGDG